ncbi:MAG: hypothetical protein M3680_29510 [Myxococcota bacterium]|nr:hypothetical protein [Myxococcota bacterium]
MNIDELVILIDDEIDYEALPTELIEEAARQTADPFIATSALAELYARDQHAVQAVCVEILGRPDPDRHLRAFALTTLYSVDPAGGARAMVTLATEVSDETLLAAMIDSVMSEPARFAASPELVAALFAQVHRSTNADLLSNPEVRDFVARFGGPRR